MFSLSRIEAAEARARMNDLTRSFFCKRNYLEVETPIMVQAPGMEPHITTFETLLDLSEVGGFVHRMYLHTSPEYAMKRLLADGFQRIFQLCKVFRSEPPSSSHNPEFSMLEFYCSPGNHETIMTELENLVEDLCISFCGDTLLPCGTSVKTPFPRIRVQDIFYEATGVDIADFPQSNPDSFAKALKCRAGMETAEDDDWDDLFFRAFLDHVEPKLGKERAVYLVDYPAHMASLARLRRDDPRWAERFELYIGGVELANGFHELADSMVQMKRLEKEKEERRKLGRPEYPVDADFIRAVERLPDAGGVAVGMDRLLMLLIGAESIDQVLLFPMNSFSSFRDEKINSL